MLGAGIPLVVSMFIILFRLLRSKRDYSPRRFAFDVLFVMGIGVVVAFPYIIAWQVYHSLGLSKWVIIPIVFGIGFAQVVILDRPKKMRIPFKSYVLWTFGSILSDLIRIFSGIRYISPPILIIGADRFYDTVFLLGPYLMTAYFFFAAFYVHFVQRGRPTYHT